MHSVLQETQLTLKEAAALIKPGRSGRKCHISTLVRWITDGLRGPGANVVRLEAVRLGGRWITSEEALARFSERLTPDNDSARSPAPRSPGRRRKASERAERHLRNEGI